MSQKRILILDIETSPIIAYVWGIKDQNLGLHNIKDDWYIMAFSAKWLGDSPSKIMYFDQRNEKDPANDKRIITELWKLLDEADVVVTQNGESFDVPRIDGRMMLYGMKPYSPIQHHDTYRQLKGKGFTSHKLEYLTAKFCVKYKKLKHKKFPGMSLWAECLKGNKEAWTEMQKYNNYDVLSTEELYLATRGWSRKNAPEMFEGDDERLCKFCGEFRLTKQKKKLHRGVWHNQLQCQECGKWQLGGKI